MRPTILTFVPSYLPGYKGGGPIRSISNMVEAMGDEFQFLIVTADRDLGDSDPYDVIKHLRSWTQVGKAQVLYLSPSRRGLLDIWRILRDTSYDVLYLNSFFSPDFTAKPLLARKFGRLLTRPCIVAPRGEFSTGALSQKAWKKWPYIAAARAAGLYDGVRWQASAEYDAEDIRRAMRVDPGSIRIAMDMPSPRADAIGTSVHHPRRSSDPLRICFVSRISPKKNLDFALEVLQRAPMPIRFSIFGPIEDRAFWAKCCDLIGRLPAHVEAAFEGSVEHSAVRKAFAASDLFFFPTRGENYGHVIAESLMEGTPVLVSDRTPWRNLEAAGVGWDLPLEGGYGPFLEKILLADTLSKTQGPTWRERVADFVIDDEGRGNRRQEIRGLLSF